VRDNAIYHLADALHRLADFEFDFHLNGDAPETGLNNSPLSLTLRVSNWAAADSTAALFTKFSKNGFIAEISIGTALHTQGLMNR